tara:strand:+ start:2238 stop:5165 length:2928 start_codon:yes stop_codon:yes gene_type:complete
MAENPFDPANIEQYKSFFQKAPRPNVLGTESGRAAIESERAGLASFLGATDYSKQLEEAQNMGKLQFGLALAQRGFAAAGATPRRGESSISTLSRELLSPIAGDAGSISNQMMQQRQALKQAERQEERQLRLSALENVRARQAQEYSDQDSITEKARNLSMQVRKKNDEISNDYLIDGKNIPVIVRKNWTGKLDGFFKLDGTPINNALVKSATNSAKSITSWAKDVQIKGPKGNWIDAPDALKIADATGENSRLVVGSSTLDFNKESPTYNARIVAKKGSGTSAFYSPTSRSVYLNQSAIELFNLSSNLVGQEAVFKEYALKPDMAGPNSRPVKELVVGGKSFFFNEHSGYKPETGDLTVQRGPNEAPVTFRAENLFGLEDPKAFTGAGELTVPSDPARLGLIQGIQGLVGISPGEKLSIERNKAGKTQVRYGNVVVVLTDDQSALFQTSDLSEVDKVTAGQVTEKPQSYVNQSKTTVEIAGQSVAPGQVANLTKTDIDSDAFKKVSSDFRQVGPVSTDTVNYMFKGPEVVDGVNYLAGDSIPFTPQQFNNLPPEFQKNLVSDAPGRANVLKKEYITSLFKTVQSQNPELPQRAPTKEEIQTLLGIFPGTRSGGTKMRDEVFNILKLSKTANPDANATPAVVASYDAAESYASSVKKQLDSAKTRYEKLVARDVLGPVPWETLSYQDRRAFADIPKTLQATNVQGFWDNSKKRIQDDKKEFTKLTSDDETAFAAATELLILAKYLDKNSEIDKTGVFTGFLGKLGANTFADINPLPSASGSLRLQQIINRMKTSYGTLAGTEGSGTGRDSVYKQRLQSELIPAFSSSTNLNRANLKSIINRLEANIRSSFSPEVKGNTVIPKGFEIMAKEAGVTGVSVDQTKYRWLDPNEPINPAVTRQRVMESIGIKKIVFEDIANFKTGKILPPAPRFQDRRFVKIKNLSNGEVLIREAKSDGRPDETKPLLIFGTDMKTRIQ